jgi:hypothetical protein
MFIEKSPARNLFAPEERDIRFVDRTLRSYGAKEAPPTNVPINIWPLCGPAISGANFRDPALVCAVWRYFGISWLFWR